MERINAFRARDGKVFEDEAACLAHEAELGFDDWYQNNELLGNYAGSRVELRDMKSWLRENRERIAALLGLKA